MQLSWLSPDSGTNWLLSFWVWKSLELQLTTDSPDGTMVFLKHKVFVRWSSNNKVGCVSSLSCGESGLTLIRVWMGRCKDQLDTLESASQSFLLPQSQEFHYIATRLASYFHIWTALKDKLNRGIMSVSLTQMTMLIVWNISWIIYSKLFFL